MTETTTNDIAALLKEVDELPRVGRSLLTHNEEALIDFCHRLAQPLRAATAPSPASAPPASTDPATSTSTSQAAAVKTLWCVHHRGPDDVIPVASYDDAVKMADAINDRSEKFNFGHKPDGINYVYSRAYPAPWPHSPESHAAGLAPATSTGESSHG